MSLSRRYYLVGEGPVLEEIQRAEEQHREFMSAMRALGEELGGDVWVADESMFIGVRFSGEAPEGWRHSERKGYATPNQRTTKGRELAARFKALPMGVSSWRFSERLGRKFTPLANGHIYFTTFEKWGCSYVLSVPVLADAEPDGCVPLKASEYWALREACEASMAVSA